jgi:hypothetical protein
MNDLSNSQALYQLSYPGIENWSGTSDSNRDSLGPRPSGLNRFPSPRRNYSIVKELKPARRFELQICRFGNDCSLRVELRRC